MSVGRAGLRHSQLVDVLQGAAGGETLAEAAIRLGVSSESISYRRKLAYDRVGARNAPEAVAIAFRKGWLV